MIELEYLRELIAAVDESGIDSLEITRAGTRIRIAKTPSPSPGNNSSGAVVHHAPASGGAAATPQGNPAAAAPPAPAEPPRPDRDFSDITSPMVGTFYRAPAPEAPPYVEIGTPVSKGQTLCILEAMKLMNELQAEVEGVVREILVENGEPVEYGQVLFRIEPARAA